VSLLFPVVRIAPRGTSTAEPTPGTSS
jgi:hypothetical protein